MAWKPVKDQLQWNDVGGRLLANLARGIYVPQAVLREYVQNACDAYAQLPSPPKDPAVTISVDGSDLIVHDSAIGMDEADIKEAKKIAVSPKYGTEDVAGFRGIGIWAGFQACDTLEVITTKLKSPNRYKLTINFSNILKHVDENINIKELVDPNYSIYEDSAPPNEHYTQVRLKHIHKDYKNLLDTDELQRIAASALPCNVAPSFSQASAVNSFLDGVPDLLRAHIFVKTASGNVDVYRQYPAEPLDGPYQLSLKDASGGELARVWYCRTRKAALLKTDPPNSLRGFQLRIHNIAVGPSNIFDDEDGRHYGISRVLDLKTAHRLSWFCGEIHVTDHTVLPNTARDSVETDARGRALIEAIREFYQDRIQEAGAVSDFNSFTRALKEAEDLVKAWPSAPDPAQRDELIERLTGFESKARKKKAPGTASDVFRSLANQPDFKIRRKKVTAALPALKGAIKAPPPKKSPPAKKGKPPADTSKAVEALVSEITAILEKHLGEDAEEVPALTKEIQAAIVAWSTSDAG